MLVVELLRVGKRLSYVLRHRPGSVGLRLDDPVALGYEVAVLVDRTR